MGYKQLFSYFVPGLLGGTHKIHVKQDISTEARVKDDPRLPDLSPETAQEFDVLASRFDLPADAVYSVYPEQGQSATHDTLPHVVFNDHMLPWERIGSFDLEEQQPPPADASYNRVPWLACLVFTPEELQIGKPEMDGIFGPTSIKTTAKQNESFAVSVPITDLLSLKNGTARVPFTDTDQANKPDVNIIFPTAAHFNALFSAYDDNNKPQASARGGPDISRHRFLAHFMRMNTLGMANADRDAQTTNREFSVVIANRVGPLVGDKVTQMIVHVVSLENLESLKPFPLPVSTSASPPQPTRVGLVSLYSWSYTCLPPNSLNVEDTFKQLGSGAGMLRPILPTNSSPDPVESRLLDRLGDGYTVVRYRTPTGEETAALMRGALTPNIIPANINMEMQSNSGSNLKILDRELGMLDLTYAAAWSLGRTLALADRAYTIALTRVRHQIMKPAVDQVREQMVCATGRMHYTKTALAQSIRGLVDEAVAASRTTASAGRWTHAATAGPLDLSYRAAHQFLESAIERSAYEVSSSLEPKPKDWTLEYAPPYDEFNEPTSPDWMVVFRFVMDLYYLINVPSHHLLPDQSMLPPESLRFFFIDQHWIDALVDGALSLGNHGGTDPDAPPGEEEPSAGMADDPVRRAIKRSINRFFHEPLCAGRKPAIPRFGFYMRSAVVAQFPDLRVSVDPKTRTVDGAPMLLRHDIIDKDTMVGFFSEKPLTDAGLQGLRFEIPAHQQYFSAGNIKALGLGVTYRRQYTTAGVEDPGRNQPAAALQWERNGKGTRVYKSPEDDGKKKDLRERVPVFVWGSAPDANDVRLLLVDKVAQDVWMTVTEEMKAIQPGWFSEAMATSAMTGLQLSASSWQLQIGEMPAALGVAFAIAQAQAGSISGALTYRAAPTVGTTAVVQTVPAKTRHALPMHLLSLPNKDGYRRNTPTPHMAARYRIHDTEYFAPEGTHSPSTRGSGATKTTTTTTGRPPKGKMTHRRTGTLASWDLVPAPSSPSSTGARAGRKMGHRRTGTLASWDLVSSSSSSSSDNDSSDFEDLAVAGAGEFEYLVTSTSDPSKDMIPLVPTRQDLVFSIVYAGNGRTFALKGFVITIPVQVPNKDNLIEGDTFGKGGLGFGVAKMVSNLRFNVRSSYSEQEKSLSLSLVPRSRAGRHDGVPMFGWTGKYPSGFVDPEGDEEETDRLSRTELSVVLYGVKVVQYQNGGGSGSGGKPREPDVEVRFQPIFSTSPSEPKVVYAKLRKPVAPSMQGKGA